MRRLLSLPFLLALSVAACGSGSDGPFEGEDAGFGPAQADAADSGDGAPCPDDAYEPTTTVCRPAGDCDVEERCAGWSPNCPEDALKTSSTICRPHQGVCDRHERCTGNSPTCPEDNWRGPGEVDQGLCDLSMKMACSGKGIGEEHCLPTDGTPGAVCGNGGNCISGSCVDNVCQ